jgi:hypothetical protein
MTFKEQQSQLVNLHLYLNNTSNNNTVIQQQLHKKELKKKMMEKMRKMFLELTIQLITLTYRSVLKLRSFLNIFKDINPKKLILILS